MIAIWVVLLLSAAAEQDDLTVAELITRAQAAYKDAAAHLQVQLRKQQLTAFYEKHEPAKVSAVDTLLAHKHTDLLASLKKKYGTVPEGWEAKEPQTHEDVAVTVATEPAVSPFTTCGHRLPILTSKNLKEYAEWHEYYNHVYGQPVAAQVDLNTFTWFYSFAPLPSKCVLNTFDPKNKGPYIASEDGTVVRFQGKWPPSKAARNWPEVIITKRGAFVKRPVDSSVVEDKYIEVLRTNHGEGADETNECWFYHTTGSGFWIKNDPKQVRQVVNYPNHVHELVSTAMTGGANDLDIEVYFGSRQAMRQVPLEYDQHHGYLMSWAGGVFSGGFGDKPSGWFSW
jgi:hypothetical protein